MNTLDEVEKAAIGREDDGAAREIRLVDLERWMESSDIEVLGAVYSIISEVRTFSKVSPPPDAAKCDRFALSYIERCIRHDPHGEWASTRYEAAYDATSWFEALWAETAGTSAVLSDLRETLARLTMECDAAVQDCIVTGVLEHLFQNRKIQKFFAGWAEREVLKDSYKEGCELASGFLKFKAGTGNSGHKIGPNPLGEREE